MKLLLFLLVSERALACSTVYRAAGLGMHDASATAVSITFTRDGANFSWPSHALDPCDQFVAMASNMSVRGVGVNTTVGWDIGVLGTVGEKITFHYWSEADRVLLSSTYTFIMQDDAAISTYSSPLVLDLSAVHDPCVHDCSYYSVMGFSFAVPSDNRCVSDDGRCRYEPSTDFRECFVDSELTTPCYRPFPPPFPAPPPLPPPPLPPPHCPSPSVPPANPAGCPRAPPPPPRHPPPSPLPSPPLAPYTSTCPPPPPPSPDPPVASPSPPPTPKVDDFPSSTLVAMVIVGLMLVGVSVAYFATSERKRRISERQFKESSVVIAEDDSDGSFPDDPKQ